MTPGGGNNVGQGAGGTLEVCTERTERAGGGVDLGGEGGGAAMRGVVCSRVVDTGTVVCRRV